MLFGNEKRWTQPANSQRAKDWVRRHWKKFRNFNGSSGWWVILCRVIPKEWQSSRSKHTPEAKAGGAYFSNLATLMRLLPCKNWSDFLFFIFLTILGRYLVGITDFFFWCEAFQKMECPHLCPMRFYILRFLLVYEIFHTELHHFILRFIKMSLLCGYHWKRG